MPVRSIIFAQVAPSIVGLVALIVVAGLWLISPHSVYDQLLTLWGITPFQFPFVDIDGSLAAWECARQGIDVILANPCDVLARGYNYSPFWMTLDWIPLGRSDRIWVGLILGIAFLVSLSALPPPLSRTETALRLAAVFSTTMVFAIERANPDLLIFILVIAMIYLLRRSLIARWGGYCIAFLTGAIKYYPFILLGLMLREQLRVGIAVTGASLIGLIVFWCIYSAQILEGLPGIARGVPFGDMFGAKNFPLGMAQVVRHVTNSPDIAAKAGAATTILLLVIIPWLMFRLRQQDDLRAALSRLDEPRRLALLAGALLLTGCFFAGQSVGYRGIFLLLVLPGLFALGWDNTASAIASAARLATIGIPLLMWAQAERCWIHIAATGHYPPPGFMSVLVQPVDFIAWCGREIAWWFLVAFLLTILFDYIIDRFRALVPQHNSSKGPYL